MIPTESLVRSDIVEMAPYASVMPIEVLAEKLGMPASQITKLDANENPYGPAPQVMAALSRYPYYSIYPDPEQMQLRRAISAYIGQPVERILCGNGSEELIDLLVRLCIQPGDTVIDCPPTFSMYSFKTRIVGGRVVRVPRAKDFIVDVEAVAKAVIDTSAKILFLPSPNNPDGSTLTLEMVLDLLKLPSLLVIDEVYAEFSDSNFAALVGQYPNLIVVRSFSKWAGLAGLRIGYGLFPESLVAHLWKIKPPYNLNAAAQVAVLASLQVQEELQTNVARIIAERERLLVALKQFNGLWPYPSQANFILCRVLQADAQSLRTRLQQRGILLRHFRDHGVEDCLRISIGTQEQNDRLLTALSEVL